MDYSPDSIVNETFQLNGESIPYSMRNQLLKDKGNNMDLKCCHCAVFLGERKSLDGEVSNL